MPKFSFIYRGGKPFETPEDGKAHTMKWRAWAESLGSAYVYPGMPFSSARTVSTESVSEGSGEIPMNGVSVVEAETMDAAVEMAKACPHLNTGGDIVVAQGMDMEM